MGKVIPSVLTNEEQCTLTFLGELVFILKGHSSDSGMLLAVKREEISSLKYVVFLVPSNTLRLAELRKHRFRLSVDLRKYQQIKGGVQLDDRRMTIESRR